MSVFGLLLLIYFIYRFIAGFLLPLFRNGRNMRQQFNGTNGQGTGPAGPSPSGTKPADAPHQPKSGTGKVGEYIDFEEVK